MKGRQSSTAFALLSYFFLIMGWARSSLLRRLFPGCGEPRHRCTASIAVASLVAKREYQSTQSKVMAPGLWSSGSRVVVQGLSLLFSTWDLPGSGIKSVSPVMADGSTESPGEHSSEPFCFHLFKSAK